MDDTRNWVISLSSRQIWFHSTLDEFGFNQLSTKENSLNSRRIHSTSDKWLVIHLRTWISSSFSLLPSLALGDPIVFAPDDRFTQISRSQWSTDKRSVDSVQSWICELTVTCYYYIYVLSLRCRLRGDFGYCVVCSFVCVDCVLTTDTPNVPAGARQCMYRTKTIVT